MNVIYAKLFWILIAVILVLLFIVIPAIGYLFKDNPEFSFSIQKSLGIIFLVIVFILIIMIIYFTIIKFDTEAYLKSQGFKGSEKEKEIAKRFFGDWTVRIALLLLTIVGLWFPLEMGYPGSFIALRRYFNVFIIHAIIIVVCTILIYLRYKKYKNEAEESFKSSEY